MPTKTIGLGEDAYERLKARKREDESFTDLVNRLLDESTPDWREGFGTLSEGDAEALVEVAEGSRRALGSDLSDQQADALEAFAEVDPDDAEAP
jgi:predicted CopG family antitoxin